MNYYIGHHYMEEGIYPKEHNVMVPIEWIPVERGDGEILLITKNVIELCLYDDYATTWDKSYLKSHLNTDMLNEWFSADEAACIKETTWGKIFIPSARELVTWFPKREERRCVLWMLNKDDHKESISIEHYFYWLRNDMGPNEEGRIAYVETQGELYFGSADMDEVGVRPCILVDEAKARLLSAKTGYNKWHHWWDLEDF